METIALNIQQKIDAYFYISDLLIEMSSEASKVEDYKLSISILKENEKVLKKTRELMDIKYNKNQN